MEKRYNTGNSRVPLDSSASHEVVDVHAGVGCLVEEKVSSGRLDRAVFVNFVVVKLVPRFVVDGRAAERGVVATVHRAVVVAHCIQVKLGVSVTEASELSQVQAFHGEVNKVLLLLHQNIMLESVKMKNQHRREFPNVCLPDAVPLLVTLAARVLKVRLLVVVVEQVPQRTLPVIGEGEGEDRERFKREGNMSAGPTLNGGAVEAMEDSGENGLVSLP